MCVCVFILFLYDLVSTFFSIFPLNHLQCPHITNALAMQFKKKLDDYGMNCRKKNGTWKGSQLEDGKKGNETLNSIACACAIMSKKKRLWIFFSFFTILWIFFYKNIVATKVVQCSWIQRTNDNDRKVTTNEKKKILQVKKKNIPFGKFLQFQFET